VTILTVNEVAKLLKLEPNQVRTMMRTRTRNRMEHPIPYLKINSNLRFSKEAIEEWLVQVSQEAA
jgi:hypothetical protein